MREMNHDSARSALVTLFARMPRKEDVILTKPQILVDPSGQQMALFRLAEVMRSNDAS